MKRLTYLLVIALFSASACEKKGDPTEEEQADKANFPTSTVGNNKIRVLETTSGASTPEVEYDLDYLLVTSKTSDGKAQTIILPTSTGPNLTIVLSEGIPTKSTVFDLENMFTGGKNGVTLSRGSTYSSVNGYKLYVRKNSNGTTTFFFNELDLKGTLNRSQKTSVKFTIPATLEINTESPAEAKNFLVGE
ncbi:MAG TPA: hypothetical protein PKA53_01260 [Sphingobacterium sp.]|nr:hypothetical protein [Sphingobacterium sp.]